MTLLDVSRKLKNSDKEESKSNWWAQIWPMPKNNKKYFYILSKICTICGAIQTINDT